MSFLTVPVTWALNEISLLEFAWISTSFSEAVRLPLFPMRLCGVNDQENALARDRCSLCYSTTESERSYSLCVVTYKLHAVEWRVKYRHHLWYVSTQQPVNWPQSPLKVWVCNISSDRICIKAPRLGPPLHLSESNHQNEALDFVSCPGWTKSWVITLIYTIVLPLVTALLPPPTQFGFE